MIELIPSVSVLNGKCARLAHGDYASVSYYDQNPIDLVHQFEEHGIKRVHFIDLDGARQGTAVNLDMLRLIAGHTNVKVDFGGGVTTDGDLSKAFEYGASMVTVGSLAASKRDTFSSWLVSYGRNKLILSADSLDGKIRIRGWQTGTEIDLYELLEYYYERSVLYVKCADVAKDGMLTGPTVAMYDQIHKRFPGMRLLASGGVSSIDDIKRLEDIGVHGVIFGKAFYEGKLTLDDIDRYIGQQTQA